MIILSDISNTNNSYFGQWFSTASNREMAEFCQPQGEAHDAGKASVHSCVNIHTDRHIHTNTEQVYESNRDVWYLLAWIFSTYLFVKRYVNTTHEPRIHYVADRFCLSYKTDMNSNELLVAATQHDLTIQSSRLCITAQCNIAPDSKTTLSTKKME